MRVLVSDLVVDFAARGVRALDGVALTVAAGEQVALLGRSGSGKTTLLRVLLGAVPRTRGRVVIDGADPASDAAARQRVRRSTGVIRQGDDLVLGLSAQANAVLGTAPTWRLADWIRVARGVPPDGSAERLATLAERHGIGDCLPARASQLSGGQRQRVALVRALLPGPRLLLADEPTAGLDPATKDVAVDALLAAGVTLLAATHDLSVARRFPRVVVLRDGRVVHDGPLPRGAAARALYAAGDDPAADAR